MASLPFGPQGAYDKAHDDSRREFRESVKRCGPGFAGGPPHQDDEQCNGGEMIHALVEPQDRRQQADAKHAERKDRRTRSQMRRQQGTRAHTQGGSQQEQHDVAIIASLADWTTIKAAIGAQYVSGKPMTLAASNASTAARVILAECAKLVFSDATCGVFIGLPQLISAWYGNPHPQVPPKATIHSSAFRASAAARALASANESIMPWHGDGRLKRQIHLVICSRHMAWASDPFHGALLQLERGSGLTAGNTAGARRSQGTVRRNPDAVIWP
jgi:hypothetical protein